MKIGCVIMASGLSRRFGGNKLLAPFLGEPLALHALRAAKAAGCFEQILFVTRSEEAAILAQGEGVAALLHRLPLRSDAVRVGINAMQEVEGCLFALADQPLCRPESLRALCAAFEARPQSICRLAFDGVMGSPVLFPAAVFGELAALTGKQGGGAVAAAHPEWVVPVQAACAAELWDADTPEALQKLEQAAQTVL